MVRPRASASLINSLYSLGRNLAELSSTHPYPALVMMKVCPDARLFFMSLTTCSSKSSNYFITTFGNLDRTLSCMIWFWKGERNVLDMRVSSQSKIIIAWWVFGFLILGHQTLCIASLLIKFILSCREVLV